jgi:hypothetical protein
MTKKHEWVETIHYRAGIVMSRARDDEVRFAIHSCTL